MKSKLFTTIITLLSGVVLFSCYEDKGNYDYTTLKTLKIDLPENFKKTYSVYQSDALEIQPNIVFEGNAADLKFCWYIFQRDGMINSKLVKADTISHARNLNESINVDPERYTLIFSVEDTNTGIKDFASFDVNVQSYVGRGWMVLHGDDNGGDVDLIISRDVDEDAIEERTLRNIYSRFNGGFPMEGKPMQVCWHSTAEGVRMFTDKKAAFIETVGFTTLYDYADFFYSPPDVLKFEGYAQCGRNELLVNNGDVYAINGGTLPNDWKFSYKLLEIVEAPDGLKDSYVSPFLSQTGAYGLWGVVFDVKHSRFLRVGQYAVNLQLFTEPASNTYPFDMNAINRNYDLLSVESGPLASSGFYKYFCIFRDRTNQLTYLYVLSADTPTTPTHRYPHLERVMSISATDVDDARFFQMSGAAEVLFYGTDKKIYIYNYLADEGDGQVWSRNSGFVPEDANEVITSMKLFKYYKTYTMDQTPYPNALNRLMFVATFNPTTSEGKVYKIPCNISNGDFDNNNTVIYRGFKKIYDMNAKLK